MLKQPTASSLEDKPLPRGLEWAFAAGAVGFLGMAIWFVRELTLALASRNWRPVEGAIVRMETSSNNGRDGRLIPVYQYKVAETEYTGSRLAYGFPEAGFGNGFEERTGFLRRTGPVKVFHDPDSPSKSVLWNQGPSAIVWIGTFAWPLGCAGFVWAFFEIRRSHREALSA